MKGYSYDELNHAYVPDGIEQSTENMQNYTVDELAKFCELMKQQGKGDYKIGSYHVMVGHYIHFEVYDKNKTINL